MSQKLKIPHNFPHRNSKSWFYLRWRWHEDWDSPTKISGLFGKCDYINCATFAKKGEKVNQISKKLSASISSLWEAMIERRAFRYWIVGFTLLAEKWPSISLTFLKVPQIRKELLLKLNRFQNRFAGKNWSLKTLMFYASFKRKGTFVMLALFLASFLWPTLSMSLNLWSELLQ